MPSIITATNAMLSDPNKTFRIGARPTRIEILTAASGIRFDDAYSRRTIANAGDLEISTINLSDLRINKRASARLKDLSDLEGLQDA